jgi:hypothetical protein
MSRQGETVARLIELLDEDPNLDNMTLATRLGVTRARISQLRIRLNRRPIKRKNWHPCMVCDNLVRERAKFCSVDCRKLWSGGVKLTCETCGKQFIRGTAIVSQRMNAGQKHIWCSRKCQGTWLGNWRGRLGNFVGR